MTTPLDAAHAAMEAAPGDDSRRLAFFGLLADTELFLLLEDDSDGDRITPALFDVEGAQYLVAFDSEDRLTAFTGKVTPYAALPGRGLAAMIAGEGIGVALNAELPSAMLVPPEGVDWLAETLQGTLAGAPDRIEARPQSLHPPGDVPAALLAALESRLGASGGRATGAWLASVAYDDGTGGHVLAIAGAAPGSENAFATAVREALVFSGQEEGWLDVTFLAPGDPVAAAFARTGLALPLPAPPRAAPASAPDSGATRPPRLR
ncbi:MAG: SseB family protein [Rubellimicrobium sp.]|nr:SseB family protein [Rubellimicrobium sp.]